MPEILPSGFVVLDKPTGITSAHAVAKVKRLLRVKKIGHGGTLDPMASGILPLGVNKATKLLSQVVDGRKTYRFTIAWGEERDTDDAEGKVTATTSVVPMGEEIEAALPAFTGTILQTPPIYSAIKLQGERAYDMARAGREVKLEPRPVEVFRLQVIDFGIQQDSIQTLNLKPQTSFEMECGKGTYVRSLARDLARKLNSLGYVSALRRTRVGAWGEQEAISLENLTEMVHKGGPFSLDGILVRSL